MNATNPAEPCFDDVITDQHHRHDRHHDHPSQSFSLPRRIVYIVLACTQSSLVGGMLYGWASIDTSLLAAPLAQGGAALTLDETTRLFTYGSSVAMLSLLGLGLVLDYGGPRLCSLLSHALIALGCELMARAPAWKKSHNQQDSSSSSSSSSVLLFTVGVCLLAFGGPGVQAATIHLANLFPRHQFLVLSALSTSLTLSFAVFASFDALWSHSVRVAADAEANNTILGVSTLFRTYILVVLASFLSAALCWPDAPYEQIIHHQHDYHTNDDQDEASAQEDDDSKFSKSYIEGRASHEHHLVEQPLKSYLRIQQQEDHNNNNNNDNHATTTRHPWHNLHDHDLLRTPSNLYSNDAMEDGRPLTSLSLKDWPFWYQLTSATYLRALSVFLVNSYLAAFYVASFSIEASWYSVVALRNHIEGMRKYVSILERRKASYTT